MALTGQTRYLLIGAGGHSAAVVEAAVAKGGRIAAYSAPDRSKWLEDGHSCRRLDDDASAIAAAEENEWDLLCGMGGVSPDALERRATLFSAYRRSALSAHVLIHADATVSESAVIGSGTIVLARAVVQPFATVGEMAIINTGAIVEHHASIGDGAHVAPGAVVLGEASIGACAMIGANAVVLPGKSVPAGGLVKANAVWMG